MFGFGYSGGGNGIEERRHGSSEQAMPMENASKRSSRTNSHTRQVPLHHPRYQHLHLYPHSRPRSTPFSLFSLPIQCPIRPQTKFWSWCLQVYGPSMLPTLNLTGDVLLVENLTVRMGKLGPGDVVLVRSPENPRKTVSKRILGMEGDTVTFMIDPSNSDRCQSIVVCSWIFFCFIYLFFILWVSATWTNTLSQASMVGTWNFISWFLYFFY